MKALHIEMSAGLSVLTAWLYQERMINPPVPREDKKQKPHPPSPELSDEHRGTTFESSQYLFLLCGKE